MVGVNHWKQLLFELMKNCQSQVFAQSMLCYGKDICLSSLVGSDINIENFGRQSLLQLDQRVNALLDNEDQTGHAVKAYGWNNY